MYYVQENKPYTYSKGTKRTSTSHYLTNQMSLHTVIGHSMIGHRVQLHFLVAHTWTLVSLPDPGGRATKGFVGPSVGRSVHPSLPPPTSRGGLA